MKKPLLLPSGTRARIRVPASTSNLGPGFDAFGCALNLANEFTWTLEEPGHDPTFVIDGPEGAGIPADSTNLAVRSAAWAFGNMGLSEDVSRRLSLHAKIAVPKARGLGSSSTAIVGGIAGAAAMLKDGWPVEKQLELAVRLEGHPDNVSACLLGGLIASVPHTQPLVWRKFRPHRSLRFVVAIPDYEVRTADARAALQASISRGDAIHNLARTPLLLEAIRTGDVADLRELMSDRIHQPARAPLYRGYGELEDAAYVAGAAGFCVSGAGPAMLAIAVEEQAASVRQGLLSAFKALRIDGHVEVMKPDWAGTQVTAFAPQ